MEEQIQEFDARVLVIAKLRTDLPPPVLTVFAARLQLQEVNAPTEELSLAQDAAHIVIARAGIHQLSATVSTVTAARVRVPELFHSALVSLPTNTLNTAVVATLTVLNMAPTWLV